LSREEAKSIKTAIFIKNLNVAADTKQRLLEMLERCCKAWRDLAKRIGVVHYDCKVLGTMNENYTS
jgi:hypothetical protein